jgi:hypothetical protein
MTAETTASKQRGRPFPKGRSRNGRFDEARLREVMRQQLWLGRSAADHVIA